MTDREYPEQSYYPAARVRLIIRFEEFGSETSAETPETIPTKREGDGQGVPQVNQQGGPQEQASSADDLTHAIDGIIPKRAQLCLNGIQQADTLSLEFKYADLPIDPRTVRSAAVQFYLGCIKPEDFAAGIEGSTRVESAGRASEQIVPVNMLPEKFTGPDGKERSNLRFEGWVDDWNVNWDEGEPIARISCTDNTRQLIEQDAPPQLTIDPQLPIDEAIKKYIDEFPQFQGYEVRFEPAGGERPSLSVVTSKASVRKGKGPTPGKAGGGGDTSVWDYLTDVCGMLGFALRFEGTDIVVQQLRTLVKNPFPTRPDDPFTGRDLPSGTRLERRTMVYGRNTIELSVERNFTKHAATNIEVRCYVPEIRRVLVARHPLKSELKKRANPGEAADLVYSVIKVAGISDKKTLRRIAQEAYEQLNRCELTASFKTKNLASYGGGPEDPDLLDMRAGDPIDIEMQREEEALQGMTAMNLEDTLAIEQLGVDLLTQLGYSQEFSRAYAKAFVSTSLSSTFRVRKVDMDWDEDDGVDIACDAVNFAVINRSDESLPDDEEEDA